MVDTNIVVDILSEDGAWHDWSLGMLAAARGVRPLAMAAVVIGELAVRERSYSALVALCDALDISVSALDGRAAYRAGLAQLEYRRRGGRRESLLGDFLIGAHAETMAADLLTRDPRRYRTYFPELTLITPDTDNG